MILKFGFFNYILFYILLFSRILIFSNFPVLPAQILPYKFCKHVLMPSPSKCQRLPNLMEKEKKRLRQILGTLQLKKSLFPDGEPLDRYDPRLGLKRPEVTLF
jgi:hypothetical protein